ncbi:hypothetical protein ElyMa_005575200 [Elysia marginata]|uniref:Uncharacterized protein n=1 Tax=Elysia marginata TaxID=1093978 RepID=A0AAV4F2S0_9GAST|nr:hypothetical protein ElyMa_005575200 [Elysia marginata]
MVALHRSKSVLEISRFLNHRTSSEGPSGSLCSPPQIEDGARKDSPPKHSLPHHTLAILPRDIRLGDEEKSQKKMAVATPIRAATTKDVRRV